MNAHGMWRSPVLVLSSTLICSAVFGQMMERESLRLRIENRAAGTISVSADGGRSWCAIGAVVAPADRVNPNSYTAAGWAADSAIAATATNALHIRIGTNANTGRPMTISLVPEGRIVGAANRQLSSAIVTDLSGGGTIFGGGLGPYVNNPVFRETAQGLRPLPVDYQPHLGDVLVIVRQEPTALPRSAVFENRPGGSVQVDYGEGPKTVGVVDQAVCGIGRFEGAIYAAPGRIRANHPGVIDVSTSPFGMVGGFQIIPRDHAASPEMAYAKRGAQWLVIGPVRENEGKWSGQPPFFSSTILPSYRPDDIFGDHPDWMQRVLSRTLVQVRVADGPWEPMPRIAFSPDACTSNEVSSQRGRRNLWLIPAPASLQGALPRETATVANHSLEGITHFRVIFPMAIFSACDCPAGGGHM